MKKITIGKNDSGGRADKFLASAFAKTSTFTKVMVDKSADKKDFFSYTRGEIIRQIREGAVLVNGKKIKPSYILKENDKMEINLEEKNEKLVPNKKIKLEIIYEDKNIIVVNKPAGLPVHPDFREKNNTLVNALLVKFPEIKNVGEDPMRPGIVHRLDKDTSGVMVVARNQKTFLGLKEKFKNRKIEKKYWAIIHGKLEKKEGIIDKPLARSSSYRKQVIAGKKTKTKIREATTYYKVLREWKNYSLLEVAPKTGRMHQIRVHLASVGHPIVGDKVYKTKNTGKIEAPRQMLHAKSLEFKLNGKKYKFIAELPADFKKFLNLTK